MGHRPTGCTARHRVWLLQRVQLQHVAKRQHQALWHVPPHAVVWRQEDSSHPTRLHAHRELQLCARLQPVALWILRLIREDRCQRQCVNRQILAFQRHDVRYRGTRHDGKCDHGRGQQHRDEGSHRQGLHRISQNQPHR